LNPSSTMRSITFWMASSEAWSCIATIIAIHFPWPLWARPI
jgi:hypothetical protein